MRLNRDARGTGSVTDLRRKQYAWGVEKVGVKQIAEAYPELDGQGVRVGILDSGIAESHRDLKGKVLNYKNFSAARNDEPEDDFDHGTHIAGTIAGGSNSGRQIGVAPARKSTRLNSSHPSRPRMPSSA